MATTVARLEAILTADTSKFRREMDQADKTTEGMGGRLLSFTKYAGLAAGAAGVGALTYAIHAGINEWKQSELATAQTEAVLKSTGGAANVTKDHVVSLAQALMKKSGVDDEVIQSGENMLLTFTKIRNEAGKGNKVFDDATKILLDMSVALGQDMSKSAIQLGKALNDPLKGITALKRVGVTFSEDQIAMIKSLVDTGASATEMAKKVDEASKAVSAAQKDQAAAAAKVKEAQDNVTTSTEDLAAAQDRLREATDRVKEAKYNLITAQQKAKDVQEALTGARKSARLELQGMKGDVEDAQLAEEQARLNLQAAQKRQVEVDRDSKASSLDRAQAALDVMKAERDLSQATEDRRQKILDLQAAEKKGIDGTEQVIAAKEAIRAANHDVGRSEKDLGDAQKGVGDAQKGVTKASDAQKDSRLKLVAAERNAAASSSALRAAQANLAASQRDAKEASEKTSNILAAQKIILAELNKEFGGSAEALGNTFTGRINIVKESFNNWAGDMITKMMPSLNKFGDWMSVNWPMISATIKTAWEVDIKPALESLISIVQSVVAAFQSAWPVIGPLVTAVAAIMKIQIDVMVGMLTVLAALLRGDWSAAWVAFRNTIAKVVGDVRTFVMGLLDSVGKLGGKIVGVVAGPVGKVIASVESLPSLISGAISGGSSRIAAAVSGLFEGISKTFSNIPGEVRAAIGAAVGAVGGFVDNAFRAARNVGGALSGGMMAGMEGMAKGVASIVKAAVNSLIAAWNAFHIPGLHVHINLKPLPDIDFTTPEIQFPDIPFLASGGKISETGMAVVHAGETVIPAGGGGTAVFNLSIGGDRLATIVWDQMRNTAAVYEQRNGRSAFA